MQFKEIMTVIEYVTREYDDDSKTNIDSLASDAISNACIERRKFNMCNRFEDNTQ